MCGSKTRAWAPAPCCGQARTPRPLALSSTRPTRSAPARARRRRSPSSPSSSRTSPSSARPSTHSRAASRPTPVRQPAAAPRRIAAALEYSPHYEPCSARGSRGRALHCCVPACLPDRLRANRQRPSRSTRAATAATSRCVRRALHVPVEGVRPRASVRVPLSHASPSLARAPLTHHCPQRAAHDSCYSWTHPSERNATHYASPRRR